MMAGNMRGSGIMENSMGLGNTLFRMVSLGWEFGKMESASNGWMEMKRLMRMLSELNFLCLCIVDFQLRG